MTLQRRTGSKHDRRVLDAYRTRGMACVFANFRMSTRAITKIYDQAFAPIGISACQVNALWVIFSVQPLSQTRLGEIMYLDKTTLSRTLRPLIRNQWISRRPDEDDGRAKVLSVTARGEEKLLAIFPRWDAAQKLVADYLGSASIAEFRKTARKLTTHPSVQ